MYQKIITEIRHFFTTIGNSFGQNSGVPNTVNDILNIEKSLGVELNELYKQIILNFGSCYIGLEVYALQIDSQDRNVIEQTKSFREMATKNYQYSDYSNFVAISDDGCGNYLLIKRDNDNLAIFDHETGKITYPSNLNLISIIHEYISSF